MSSVTIARALTARIGQRAVRLATIFIGITMVIWTLLASLLVYTFSPWWWLLLVPAIVLLAVFFGIRIILLFILRRVHTGAMTLKQREALDGFVDKIQALLEARATPPWVFAAICIKDLVIHRDITTVKSIIRDTTSLKKDYQDLETLFA